MKGEEVDGRETVALEHPSALYRHAVIAADLDRRNVSDRARSPRRSEFAKEAGRLEAVINPPEHNGRQRRSAAMARLAGLAGLDDKDVRGRVMQNLERVNAAFARRVEGRLAECRRDRCGE